MPAPQRFSCHTCTPDTRTRFDAVPTLLSRPPHSYPAAQSLKRRLLASLDVLGLFVPWPEGDSAYLYEALEAAQLEPMRTE